MSATTRRSIYQEGCVVRSRLAPRQHLQGRCPIASDDLLALLKVWFGCRLERFARITAKRTFRGGKPSYPTCVAVRGTLPKRAIAIGGEDSGGTAVWLISRVTRRAATRRRSSQAVHGSYHALRCTGPLQNPAPAPTSAARSLPPNRHDSGSVCVFPSRLVHGAFLLQGFCANAASISTRPYARVARLWRLPREARNSP